MVTLGPEAGYGIILILGLALGALATHGIGKQKRAAKERGKTVLVELNSNNQTASIAHIDTKTHKEGYQPKDGPYVKFEGNFTYIDREKVRPVAVYNGDTGFCLRGTTKDDEAILNDPDYQALCKKYPAAMFQAKTGESEELDGVIYAGTMAGKHVERVHKSHGEIPWVAIAVIVGLAIIILPVALIGAFKGFGG